MRFVEDRAAACGNHLAERVLAHGRVRAEQMVIDDDGVCGGGALAHEGHEAVAVARAFGAEAGFGIGGNVFPEGQILRKVAQLRAVAGLGFLRPCIDDWQHHTIAALDEAAARRGISVHAVTIGFEAVEAEVIRSPFHQRRGKRLIQGLAERREVLEEDLLLEVLGAR